MIDEYIDDGWSGTNFERPSFQRMIEDIEAGKIIKAVLQGGTPGPCAAVIGELDGILCPAHPAANPENGVAHACGHNAQLTALVGAALALSAPGVAEALWYP